MKENKTLTERWSYWDLEHGFLNALQPPPIPSPDHRRRRRRAAAATDALEDRAPLGDELPLRALSPGRSMGLSVMLNVKEDEYYCSGTESVGFKVVPLKMSILFSLNVQKYQLGERSLLFESDVALTVCFWRQWARGTKQKQEVMPTRP